MMLLWAVCIIALELGTPCTWIGLQVELTVLHCPTVTVALSDAAFEFLLQLTEGCHEAHAHSWVLNAGSVSSGALPDSKHGPAA